MCKIAWLRSLLFWVAIDLDLQGQIWLKKSNFLVSSLLEIHNHHITAREPWVPRLLHMPDCFMVVSWSPSSAHTYISRLCHSPDCFTVSTHCTYTDLIYRRSCFSCDQAALWMVQSVRLSCCGFVHTKRCLSELGISMCAEGSKNTSPWFSKFISDSVTLDMLLGNDGNFGEVINGSDQSKVKVTEVKTHLSRFRTVTQVLIHIW